MSSPVTGRGHEDGDKSWHDRAASLRTYAEIPLKIPLKRRGVKVPLSISLFLPHNPVSRRQLCVTR